MVRVGQCTRNSPKIGVTFCNQTGVIRVTRKGRDSEITGPEQIYMTLSLDRIPSNSLCRIESHIFKVDWSSIFRCVSKNHTQLELLFNLLLVGRRASSGDKLRCRELGN